MRISHRHQFIFFSNPKTGSSTVRQLLNPYADVMPVRNFQCLTDANPFYPHMRPEETRPLFRRFGWDFEGYTKFAFVRNPWARLVSLYEHIHRDADEKIPFTNWLFTVMPYDRGGGGEDWERWRRYGAYSIEHFIKDSSGNILVDKVLRLEDIDRALIPYLSTLGLAMNNMLPIGHKNRGAKSDYRDYYNAETREHVADLYRYDIVNFGYGFDP
ncbi:MAG: sulfotransferase family 2 domain-containing protein [Gammaproteobacteria bacterium]